MKIVCFDYEKDPNVEVIGHEGAWNSSKER